MDSSGSCLKRQKAQAPTPQTPIRNRPTRKVENAKGQTPLALAALALVVFGPIECPPIHPLERRTQLLKWLCFPHCYWFHHLQ